MLHHVKDLSPEQRQAIETLLGHKLSEQDDVSIRQLSCDSGMKPQQRTALLENLKTYFSEVDAQRSAASDEEAITAIDDALRSVRPTYRPLK